MTTDALKEESAPRDEKKRRFVSPRKTYSAKPSEVTRAWYVLDAAEAPF